MAVASGLSSEMELDVLWGAAGQVVPAGDGLEGERSPGEQAPQGGWPRAPPTWRALRSAFAQVKATGWPAPAGSSGTGLARAQSGQGQEPSVAGPREVPSLGYVSVR